MAPRTRLGELILPGERDDEREAHRVEMARFDRFARNPGHCLDTQDFDGGPGGISFWLPGLCGSLAAVPGEPGFSFAALYVHTSVSAGGNKSFPLNGQIVAGLKGGNLAAFGPTYTFETPVLEGPAALSLLDIAGRTDASISATLTGHEATRSRALEPTRGQVLATFSRKRRSSGTKAYTIG
jgi:hypothetical protein